MDSLEGLYYPQIVLLNETLLKHLILVFDKIAFLPNDIDLPIGHDSIRNRFSINDDILFSAFGTKQDCVLSGMYSSESSCWDEKMKRLMDTYDYLESNGFCIPIKDSSFENPSQWHPLKPFVDSDVQMSTFVQYCKSAMNKRLTIPGDPKAEIKGGGFVTRPHEYKGDQGFAALCSQRINSTLYFAGKQNLVPVSNHDFFIQLLRLKLDTVSNNENYIKEAAIHENRKRALMGLLTYEIVTEAIPPQALKRKTIQQILKYKNNSRDAQERFRSYLLKLETKLEQISRDDKVDQKIGSFVRSEVLPELEKLTEAKRIIWEKVFSESIKAVFSPKAVTPLVVASMLIFAPLPYLDTLRYGTTELLGGASAIALSNLLPKLVDLALEERQRRRHSLFYIANIK